MAVQSYRDLLVWQQAMTLVEQIYRLSNGFPKAEVYGLTSQLRRAAVSVPSNIAEGRGRNSTAEFIQFLGIAKGSLAEVETQLELAARFGWLTLESRDDCYRQSASIGRMLTGLIHKLRTKNSRA